MRKEAVSGSFYPYDSAELGEFVSSAIDSAKFPQVEKKAIAKAFSYVSPHAGYIYSGRTAAYTYRAISENARIGSIDTIVIAGPNHTGYGRPIAISIQDWHTPLGPVKNDVEFSKALSEKSEMFSIDEEAHKYEHSIEVQLPFLQFLSEKEESLRKAKYVFVCMGDQSIHASELLASSILEVEQELRRNAVLIASSDFDHYEPAQTAKSKDSKLIEALLRLDYKKFNGLVSSLEDSACGFGPISVALLYSKAKGAKSGYLLKYSNSGDTTGDYSEVVAYTSLLFA